MSVHSEITQNRLWQSDLLYITVLSGKTNGNRQLPQDTADKIKTK
jgi:hypothetical protein